MLVDNITITVKAGNGGRGSTKKKYKHPVGGDGGLGGDVYFRANINQYDLSFFRGNTEFEAQNGFPGLEGDKKGRNAEDLYIDIPVGTHVYVDNTLVTSMKAHGQEFLLLKGKRGSLGNIMQKKHPNRKVFTNEEMTGDTAVVTLDLKLHADILFIGYPNAGKSSLLNKLTNAKAKVAPYPFTTLEPQLGRMGDITLMDLPGLIDGTHEGKGLGTDFVKHTESSLAVAHCVPLDAEEPLEIYKNLRAEVKLISKDLYNKDEIVILTKQDEATEEKIKLVLKRFKTAKITPLVCTILDDETVEKVKVAFTEKVTALRKLREEKLAEEAKKVLDLMYVNEQESD